MGRVRDENRPRLTRAQRGSGHERAELLDLRENGQLYANRLSAQRVARMMKAGRYATKTKAGSSLPVRRSVIEYITSEPTLSYSIWLYFGAACCLKSTSSKVEANPTSKI